MYFPSLGLAAYEYGKDKKVKIKIKSQGQSVIKTAEGVPFNINLEGESKIRWLGANDKFKSISMIDILQAKDSSESMKRTFSGKTVFVGSTATGAHDLRNSPIDSKMPGVYAHLNYAYMLMSGFNYRPISESIKYSLIFLILGFFILVMIQRFQNAIIDLIILASIIASLYYIDYIYFIPNGYELRLFFIFFTVISTYTWNTFLSFYQTSNEKKQIKGTFSRYVAPSIVDEMLDNPEKLKVGGEKKDITCLFSDVRDFTSISENLTPAELSLALNQYMGKMTDLVFETDGTLDKYIGDAIVAYWGAPLDVGDHPNKAVGAAVQMLEALPAINDHFEEQGFPSFKIGIGLNSGECSVGNMGSDKIFSYTALGDNMNLGARLESLCKHYGAQILISEYTFERIDQTKFTCRQIDNARVKGKLNAVGVYEVLYAGHPFEIDNVSFTNFVAAYELFKNAEFAPAITLFKTILESQPDDMATNRLLAQSEKYQKNPPKESEDHTITTMTTK